MILRRITEHVKAQNWFAVGLDFLIVVVGVFVGLQVSNWNAAQADKSLGKEYTARLISDLEQDLAWNRITVHYYDTVINSAEKTIELLSVDAPDAEELVVNAYRASEYTYTAPTRATWDEVVSTGKGDLLPRHATENDLADYYKFDYGYHTTQRILDAPYRRRVRSVLPHALQKDIRESCSDLLGDDERPTGLEEDCELSMPQSVIANGAELLRANPAILTDLQYHFSALHMVRSNSLSDIIFLERAIDALSSSQENSAEESD